MHDTPGPVYKAAFSSTALSTAATAGIDFFGILPSSNSRVMIHEIELGQVSTAALFEALGVQLWRGSTASSTSAAIAPVNIHGWAAAPTAQSSVTSPCTTLASSASQTLLHAGAFDNNAWLFAPKECDRPILEVSQRLHVRLSAAQSPLKINGTITFSEIGKSARS